MKYYRLYNKVKALYREQQEKNKKNRFVVVYADKHIEIEDEEDVNIYIYDIRGWIK